MISKSKHAVFSLSKSTSIQTSFHIRDIVQFEMDRFPKKKHAQRHVYIASLTVCEGKYAIFFATILSFLYILFLTNQQPPTPTPTLTYYSISFSVY